MLVVASMIGAGVFTTSGFTLSAVGSPLMVMVCWTIAGAIAMCGAVAYGQLARLMPQSGGEYLYLSRNVHPVAGFLAGWVSLTAGFSGAIATAAVAFEQYAVPDVIRPVWLPQDACAVIVVVLCGATHALRTLAGKRFQNGVVCVKLLALATFLGIVSLKLFSHPWQFAAAPERPETSWNMVTAIATSLVWISLSYAGFNAAIYVASESKLASRSVPRALVLGTAGVTALYLILNLIFVTATTPDQLVWQEAVAAIAAQAIGGDGLEWLIRMAVALGLLSSVSAMIMSGPRVYSKMADDGVFPKLFSATRGGIPRSVALQTGIAVSLIILQRILVDLEVLRSSLLGFLIFLGTTLSLSSAACIATLFLPSIRRQHAVRPTLFQHSANLIYVLATFGSVILLVCTHQNADGQSVGWWHLTGAAATLITGLIAWQFFGTRD
jgi:amino acid transporter